MILSPPMRELLIRLGIPEEELIHLHTSAAFNQWMARLGYETRAIPGELTAYTFTRLKHEVMT